MNWLLTEEGGSSLTEQTNSGESALSLAADGGCFPAMQYLLEDHGISVTDTDHFGQTVWSYLWVENGNAVELTALLKVMVMLEDAPAAFIDKLEPQHAEICMRGR
jgi:hypothetical protein